VHWRRIVTAACEQCGRNRLPAVRAPISVAQLCEASQAWPTKWLLAPGAATRLQAAARSITGPLAIAVGPEAGFSDDETQALIAAGFTPLQLGPRTLRTETAAAAALAALDAIAGDH
jgi:16S rRNA (uracil1498-N3)-methyltransferase